jgi:hypothetical protein
MKRIIAVTLLAVLGAACAKAGTDDVPVNQASEGAMKASSQAAAGSYVGALEQSAASVQAIQAAQVKAALVKAGLTNLSGVALGITTPSETAGTGTASSKPELGVTTPSEIGGSTVDARFDANGKRS